MPDHATQTMQCMEVWGGSEAFDSEVSIAGLDAWVFSRPYKSAEAGGDVYFVSSCATGRITRLLVADVSGHGGDVAGVARELRTLMRRFVNHLDQTQFVRSMNRQFTDFSESGCFATALVTTFFAPTNTLSICNAGHPRPLLYRGGKWSLLHRSAEDAAERDGGNIPLGIEGLTDYQQFDVDLDVGDLVLCYTDSLIESCRADGEFIGEEGLLELVRGVPIEAPAKMIQKVMIALADLCPDNLSKDDVTILLFRPNGQMPRTPLRDKLLAPFRVMGSVLGALAGRGPVALPDFTIANVGGAMFGGFNRFWRSRHV